MRTAIALAGLLLAATTPLVASVARPGASRDDVPAMVVSRETFVRRVSADGTLRAVDGKQIVAPNNDWGSSKLAWLAPDGTPVKAGDVIARLDPSAAQKALVEAQADLAAVEANLASERVKSTTSITEADSAVTIATQELDQQRKYKATDPEIYSRNQIIESDIDVSLAAARRDQAALDARITRGVTRANIDLDEIERARVAALRDRASTALASMAIRAPGDGVLVLARVRGELPKLGSSIEAGQQLGEIPDVSAMEAELFVLEADGDGLAVGQPVDVVIQSRPGEIVRATIKSIDKVAKPRIAYVPINYFSVIVSFASSDRGAIHGSPGQRVRAKIVLADRRAVVVPRQAVFERGGHAIVYRRDLVRGFAPTAVTLGPATSGRVVIASGIGEGDVIALRDPVEAKKP